jgi:hypothetical protein
LHNHRPVRSFTVVFGICALATPVAAETTLNVNFGPAGATPSPTYGAAGTPGTWNTVTGFAGSAYHLTAADGSPVTLTQAPTTTDLATSDPSVSGDDATLLNNGLVTTGLETCLMFSGIASGSYEVFVYAWLPNQPTVKSRTRQDETPSTIDVGGTWTGAHVEGVTYARYVVTVGADGNLPAHSGLVPGAPAAALNAVQIRPLGSTPPPLVDGGVGVDPTDGGSVDSGSHHGGCNSSGSTSFAIVLAFAPLVWRRRRCSRTS